MIASQASRPQGSIPPPTFAGQVNVCESDPTSPDTAATQYLLNLYSDKDGFHCPVCKQTIVNPTEAIYHMADELNAGFEKLRKGSK